MMSQSRCTVSLSQPFRVSDSERRLGPGEAGTIAPHTLIRALHGPYLLISTRMADVINRFVKHRRYTAEDPSFREIILKNSKFRDPRVAM
jgi:hypothetical protein